MNLSICLVAQTSLLPGILSEIQLGLDNVLHNTGLDISISPREEVQSPNDECDIQMIHGISQNYGECQHLHSPARNTTFASDFCQSVRLHGNMAYNFWILSAGGLICSYPFISIQNFGSFEQWQHNAVAIAILSTMNIYPVKFNESTFIEFDRLDWGIKKPSCPMQQLNFTLKEIFSSPAFRNNFPCLRHKMITDLRLFPAHLILYMITIIGTALMVVYTLKCIYNINNTSINVN